MTRKIALRAFRNLCTFIGAIALFSYFYNWTVDVRHWYFTFASACVCFILWLGFYVVEVRGGVMRVASELRSNFQTKPAELPSPTAEPALPANAPTSSRPVEPDVTAPNPLPWLRPRPAQADIAGKETVRDSG